MGIETFFSAIRHNKYFGKCVSERKRKIHKGKIFTGLFRCKKNALFRCKKPYIKIFTSFLQTPHLSLHFFKHGC